MQREGWRHRLAWWRLGCRKYGWIFGLVAATAAIMLLAQAMFGRPGGNLAVRWIMWDAPHYLHLAAHGYVRGGEAGYYIVFFPLFPALIWLVHWVTFQNYLLAGLLAPNVLAVVVGVLLYKLACLDETEGVARRAVWLMMVFPTAMYLHMPYTESLFMALAVGTLYTARQRRYGWAVLLASMAAITRIQGPAVMAGLLAEIWLQDGRRFRRPAVWLAAVAGPALAFGGYLLLNGWLFGSPWHFLEAERLRWGLRPTPVWYGVLRAWRIAHLPRQNINVLLLGWCQIVAAAVGTVGVMYSFLRLRLSYAVYAAAILVLSTATSHWASVPRYMLVMFPLFIMMARWGSRRWVYWLELGLSGALAMFLMVAAVRGAQMY